MMKSGIYQIVNTVNNKIYIGSSINLPKRLCAHRSRLRRGVHVNKHLQAACNLDGLENFQFNTILFCSPAHLVDYEQRCIDGFLPEYNVAPRAGNQFGFKQSAEAIAKTAAANKGNKYNLGRKHSVETKEKISASKIGRKHSPEFCAKVSASLIGNKRSVGNSNASGKRSPESRARMSEAAIKRWKVR